MVAIFDYCAVPRPTPQALNKVLETDSQAGTVLSQAQVQERGTSVPEEILADLTRVLQTHPTIRTPDMIVPGTWQPGQ